MQSIILPHRNRPERLGRCISSIILSAYASGIEDYEIIVSDQHSEPETLKRLRNNAEGAGFVFLADPDPPFLVETPVEVFNKPRAINRGIEAARGDVLTFLDCDAVVGEQFLTGGQWLASEAGKDVTRLCYRVRYVESEIITVMPHKWARQYEELFCRYEDYPRAHEGWMSPEINAVGEWYEEYVRTDQSDKPNGPLFGNSQFSIRRDVLGDVRCDELFVGAGWEDLDFIMAIWRQTGKRYRGVLRRFADDAMFHVRNVRDDAWGNGELNEKNRLRYRAKWPMQTDVIIPTCRTKEDVAPLVAEIHATAGIPVNVIATCQPVSAAKNRNLGLEWANSSDLRIMLDDDITGLPYGWVRDLIHVLVDDPKCVMVSPQLLNPDRTWATYMMGRSQDRTAGLSVVEGPHLLTACIAIRRDELRFDEGFLGSGFEDNDYCNQQNVKYPGCVRKINHDVQVIHRNEMKQQREHWDHNKAYYLAKKETETSMKPEKKLVALWKAWRGGEWFRASLESIREHTDGAVVVIGESSWISDSPDPACGENCSGPLEEFAHAHPEYPVHRFQSPPGVNSAEQYNVGLKAIEGLYGPDTAVLIVDTDEIWPEESLVALKTAIQQHPEIDLFQGRLFAYVKSPLYQVWPEDRGTPCVALQTPVLEPGLERWSHSHNRFSAPPMANMIVHEARFHHFTYVRETEADLRLKFATSASEDRYPSNPEWWDTVWPKLPEGTNIHPTQGCEHCWPAIRVIQPEDLPPAVLALDFVQRMIDEEKDRVTP